MCRSENEEIHMKVLYVAKGLNSFVYKFLSPYLKEMKNRGWTIGVAAKDDRPDMFCNHGNIDNQIEYHNVTFGSKRLQIPNFAAVFQLVELIKRNHYQIVHCHTAVAAALTRLAAGMIGKDKPIIIYTTHGFHFYQGVSFLRWLLYFPVEHYLSKYTDVLITINQEDYQIAKKFKMKELRLLPGVGVDLSRFYPDQNIRNRLRGQLGVEDDVFVLVSVCELIPRKNVITVIRALSEMKRRRQLGKIQYWICGSGPQEKWLKKQVKKRELTGHIQFLGQREDIQNIDRAADALILLSRQEGLPVAVMEAMASGLPVICSDVRGCRDLIRSGENGLLISSDKVERVVQAIQKLQFSDGLRRKLSDASLKSIQRYDEKKIVSDVLDIYSSVVQKR